MEPSLLAPETEEQPANTYIEVGNTAETSDINSNYEEYLKEGVSHVISEFPLNNAKRKQALGSFMVETLAYLHFSANSPADKEEQISKAKTLHNFMKGIFEPADDYAKVKVGFMAEAAMAISLKEGLRLTVYRPEGKDDTEGKIDLWAEDKTEDRVFAIQVKEKIQEPEVNVVPIKVDSDGKVIGISKEFAEDAQKMVKYLSTQENLPQAKELMPVLVLLPGGEKNVNALYHQTTGSPLGELTLQLRDGMLDKFYSDKY